MLYIALYKFKKNFMLFINQIKLCSFSDSEISKVSTKVIEGY